MLLPPPTGRESGEGAFFWKWKVEWRVFGAPKPKYYGLRSDFCLQCIFEGCGSILIKIGLCLAILKTEIERSTANFVECHNVLKRHFIIRITKTKQHLSV
ncbi:hypothetical protein L596_011552 [Steinernema carpocapsae]|uniref:Uncharacterized protein n=1 Tax=Steinernema carpocapsae TaxID=34508 RepID=A0A4U5NUA1_STECR|nr:hypothetical protein L596_011552 [Steinernema carpocapsae]